MVTRPPLFSLLVCYPVLSTTDHFSMRCFTLKIWLLVCCKGDNEVVNWILNCVDFEKIGDRVMEIIWNREEEEYAMLFVEEFYQLLAIGLTCVDLGLLFKSHHLPSYFNPFCFIY